MSTGGNTGGSDARDEEAGESDPLLPKGKMEHQENIFSLLVFALPLSRLNVGHYWTLPVLITLVLFVILVTIQLGITLIAGQHIRAMSVSFKKSLIRVDDGHYDLPLSLTPLGFIGAQAQYATESVMSWLPAEAEGADTCCNGVGCAAKRIRCCDRSKVPFNTLVNQSDTSMLLKMPKTALEEYETVYTGSSRNEVCYLHADGSLDCSPPSFLYHEAWDELDSNGDGKWTLEEANTDRANLGCRFGLAANELFRSICMGIERDAQDTSRNSYTMPIVPAEIEKRQSISKGYFDWWKALAVICMVPDIHRCSGLVQKGVFDGAIRMAREEGITRGGVVDLDTALDFCQRLLITNGICEVSLPSSYMMYRSRIREKCGAPSYSPAGLRQNPYDDRDVMRVMSVDYKMYASYKMSIQFDFVFFTFLILVVWYISLLSELHKIITLWDWLRNFPVNGHSPFLTPEMEEWVSEHMTGRLRWVANLLLPTAEAHEACVSVRAHRPAMEVAKPVFPKKRDLGSLYLPATTFAMAWEDIKSVMVIESHSHSHSFLLYLVLITRIFLWIYMADIGTCFIIYNRDYEELLMNAVALAFIFKLPEFLYLLLVPEVVQSRLSGAHCAPYPTSLPTSGLARWLIQPSFWGLIAIPAAVTVVVYYNLAFNNLPFLQALQCACYEQGPTCSAASRFEKAWWDQYWQDNTALAKDRASWLGS